ncbi:hypothetical protein Q3G72_033245 [Acer saccharum]|nr:hypothetical protein Q3G72_033245 [Acer saccharum]
MYTVTSSKLLLIFAVFLLGTNQDELSTIGNSGYGRKEGTGVPENSDGQWLSTVNATTNGTSQANIVAIEFDTRKSYSQDLDGTNVTAHVQYDGKNITVSVGHNAENLDLVLSYPIDLSEFLPQKVYVGFTASTSIYTQTNCVKSWEFNGSDFDEGIRETTLKMLRIHIQALKNKSKAQLRLQGSSN